MTSLFPVPDAPTAPGAAPAYPATRREEVVEEHFGTAVADPYRWLEQDVRNAPEVAAWVDAQNRVTDACLAGFPGRARLRERIRDLFDHERFGLPVRKGGRYFFLHNTGLQNQAVLWMRDKLEGRGCVLIDPNGWSTDGATALNEWIVSEDGRHILYGIQDGGSDWRKARILDVDSGAPLPETLEWMKYTLGASWARDGSGFYYARYPEPPADAHFTAINTDHAIYFHRLGTAQTEDRLVHATPDAPTLSHYPLATEDGRWLVIITGEGTDNRYRVTLIDLAAPDFAPRVLVPGLDNAWSYVGNIGTTFFWATDYRAPRMRIVAMDVAAPGAGPENIREIVPEQEATLEGAELIGGIVLAGYLVDARTEVRRYTPEGAELAPLALPGIGTAVVQGASPEEPEAFYAFTSFNTPTAIYRYDAVTNQSTLWARPELPFDAEDFRVEQHFFPSRDGTRVPIFVVRRKDVTGPAPTLMWGYGGFGISYTPAFSASRIAWMEQGGVFVLANIRGGGEYGKQWHDAGRRADKQNSFDDFIAAAEYLIEHGITTAGQLAIQGGSNGGLLVGAVVNQRPDLFAVALPAVGVMDMLRFHRWTAGRYWVDDYGHPEREEDFRVLHAYSPYHNIRGGREYPAILVSTADTDDRVVPGHSFKYAAALQAADIGPRPHLIRIETRAGHGSGKPTDKMIEEAADNLAFAAFWTGMRIAGGA